MPGDQDPLQTQLSLLETIQKIDTAIESIEKQQAKYPKERERLDEAMAALKAELDSLDEANAEIISNKKQLEGDIANWEDKIGRHEERLKSISNDKQLKAVNKEKNTATKKKVEIGREIASIDRLIEAKEAELDIVRGKLQEKMDEHAALDLEIDEKSSEWKRSLDEKRSERESFSGKISPEILRKYELIKQKRHGIGIVLASDGTCQGCHMNIPPQLYIQLIKGASDELIVCPHCHRILFHNSEQ
jgi:hypothetical protein